MEVSASWKLGAHEWRAKKARAYHVRRASRNRRGKVTAAGRHARLACRRYWP
jgi:hypothetical protein